MSRIRFILIRLRFGSGSSETLETSLSLLQVGKAASSYTKVLHETVAKAPLLAEFNQQQQNFIKEKVSSSYLLITYAILICLLL